jgi:hypothetical protein
LKGLEGVKKLATEAADLASGTLGDRDHMLKRLGELNRLILESEVKDVAGFLFPPIAELEAGLKTPESDPYGRYRELSEKLYRSLAQTTEYHLRMLY